MRPLLPLLQELLGSDLGSSISRSSRNPFAGSVSGGFHQERSAWREGQAEKVEEASRDLAKAISRAAEAIQDKLGVLEDRQFWASPGRSAGTGPAATRPGQSWWQPSIGQRGPSGRPGSSWGQWIQRGAQAGQRLSGGMAGARGARAAGGSPFAGFLRGVMGGGGGAAPPGGRAMAGGAGAGGLGRGAISAGARAGAAGALAAGMVKLGIELVKMPARIEAFGDALVQGRENLRMFNGTIAAAFARREVREIQRRLVSGQATAGTTSELIDALDDLKDNLQPYRDLGTNLRNTAAEFMADAANRVLDGLENMGMRRVIEQLNETLGGRRGELANAAFLDFMREGLKADLTPPPLRRPRGKRGP